MEFYNNENDPYEPDEQEMEELDNILKQEKECHKRQKNRLTHIFYTESHFAGWLRTYGIRW